MDKIKCKNCGAEIEITEALSHEFEENITRKLNEQHTKEVEDAVKNAEEKASAKSSRDFQLRLEIAQKEAQEEKERSKILVNELKSLSEEMRALRRKDEERDLEMKKKLAEDEEKIRLDAQKHEREKSTLELDELKKKLKDTETALMDAQAKVKQGSQQLQGEVLELDLESKLKNAFIFDEITPIGKGVEGGDIVQKVRNQAGKVAGTILWEAKRAKWSPSWLPTLRENGRKFDATLVVLVSINMPKEIESFKVIDGVIVTSYAYLLPLAGILRRNVMSIASAKFTAENKDEKLESLYLYLQSEAFRNRFEAYAEGVIEMQNDLFSEKRSMERSWKRREKQIERMIVNLSKMYGELQGIMGSSLPDIKQLSLPGGT